MNIKQSILGWDQKSAEDISDIYSLHCKESSFVKDILESLKTNETENGAAWLLKRYLEHNNNIESDEVAVVFDQLRTIEHWESKLNILQCFPFLQIAKTDKRKVELFLRGCLEDYNKFVRAWSYNGFYELSMQYPEYRTETKQFFEMAMRDEVPSVKARIRNIMKNGF